jgi:hypothetical protein
MECPYITSKQCDSGLAEVLKRYEEDGRALVYGALLVKSLPASRYVPLK